MKNLATLMLALTYPILLCGSLYIGYRMYTVTTSPLLPSVQTSSPNPFYRIR
jgi:hypothetical protein